jgi:prevent-host-death family protein
MYTTMPITKARINLGAVVKQVSLKKEPIVLNRDGYPVAAIIDIEKLEDLMDAKELIAEKNAKNDFVEWDKIKSKYAV